MIKITIKRFKKLSNNRYKVSIGDEYVILFEDIIIKYKLLQTKKITEKELETIVKENESYQVYNDCLKYVIRKLRSKKEIKDYLIKKELSEIKINEYLKKLEQQNLINDEAYLKAYINDKVNLTKQGPNKIKRDLLQHNINEFQIDEYLLTKELELNEKLEKLICKKLTTNKKYSIFTLQNKIITEFLNAGYDLDKIKNILNEYKLEDDQSIYNKELGKITKKLSKKYEGKELEYQIKQKMYQKGFRV